MNAPQARINAARMRRENQRAAAQLGLRLALALAALLLAIGATHLALSAARNLSAMLDQAPTYRSM